MKNITYLLITIFFILSSCCKGQSTKQNHDLVYINTNKAETREFNSCFTLCKVIPLEYIDGAAIGTISKLQYENGLIFILDAQGKKILIFNDAGKVITTIKKHGKGPGEFLYPSDFYYNKHESLIYICDKAQDKLCVYNLKGSFVKEVKLSNTPSQFWLKDGIFYFYHGSSSVPRNKIYYNISTLNSKGKYKYMHKYAGEINGTEYNFNGFSGGFFNKNEKLCFCEPFNPIIYNVDENNIIEQYQIIDQDFITPEAFAAARKNNRILFDALAKTSVNYTIRSPKSINDYLLFIMENGNPLKKKIYIYNEKQQKCISIENRRDKQNNISVDFIESKGDSFFTKIDPHMLLTYKDKLRKGSFLYKLSKKIKHDDNPILILYEFITE